MDALTPQGDALVQQTVALTQQADKLAADARRAALPGSIGDAPDRGGQLIGAPVAVSRRMLVPSASALSVAIDGAGLFAFDNRGRREYGRLGDFRVDSRGMLVDGSGRYALGVNASLAAVTAGDLQKIRVPNESGGHAGAVYEIDSRGVFSRVENGNRREIARLALAVFPSPERLSRASDATATATAASGTPAFVLPGSANIGKLRSRSLEGAYVDLEGDLARLWSVRRQQDLATALAYASDGCVKTSMELVK